MGLKLFNTLGRKKQEFKPIKRGQVSVYTCGPTVYQYAHIGNLRAYLAEDILRRVLGYNGYKVRQVMNITDVGHLTSDADTGEDKIEREAKKTGKTAKEITKFYTEQFIRDLKALNIELPNKFAWASKYIKEQIELIKQLEKRGYTYKTSDGIYFDTAKFKNYGRLGGVGAGKARVWHSPYKKRETDFALWKFSGMQKRQQEWKSPWGVGYPGWHIECSAISTKELGQPFDIHTGGEDHIATHHNNEIAQSEAAYGKPLAHYWFHNAFMVVNGAKMAKSAGNFYTLTDLAGQGIEPMVFRYLAISGHYRQKLGFSKSALVGAQNSLNKLRAVFAVSLPSSSGLTRRSSQKTKMDSRLPLGHELEAEWRGNDKGKVDTTYKKRFLAAINDDLNMPKAMTVVWELLKSKKSLSDKQATLLDFDKVLGLGLKDHKPSAIPAEVKKLVSEREKARKAKDWQRSDKLRDRIAKLGFVVEDTNRGPRISTND
ncbi:cysteine--tRNA ligase [Patescibacteria group bacterium]|nr:cysteine--tRNA ligase [Patescibacteria group bacterium]